METTPQTGNVSTEGQTEFNSPSGSIFARLRERTVPPLVSRPPGKRGRHPNDCQCPKCQARRAEQGQTISEKKIADLAVENAGTPIDAKLVETCVAQTIEVADSIVVETIFAKTYRVTEDRNMARNLAERVKIKDVEKNGISKLSGQICVQYGVHGEHAALVMLCVLTSNIGIRTLAVLRTLNKLAADKAEMLRRAKNEPIKEPNGQ